MTTLPQQPLVSPPDIDPGSVLRQRESPEIYESEQTWYTREAVAREVVCHPANRRESQSIGFTARGELTRGIRCKSQSRKEIKPLRTDAS